MQLARNTFNQDMRQLYRPFMQTDSDTQNHTSPLLLLDSLFRSLLAAREGEENKEEEEEEAVLRPAVALRWEWKALKQGLSWR